MKKLFLLLFLIGSIGSAWSQIPPQAFNYSAVARNAASQPIANSTIGIQITILKTSTIGTSVYSENHFVNTDQFGLFNLIIGAGAVQSGSMSSIDWSADNYYLKVGMDANGGTNFLTMGTTQLLSVPYALHAKTAESVVGGSFSGNYNDLTNAPTNVSAFNNDAGYVTTDNDNQQLSVSATGDTLYLSNGNWVIIPGISVSNSGGGVGGGLYTPGAGVTFDGYTYSTIVMGNGQEWMSENLRTTVYANGDPIPNETDGFAWAISVDGLWSHFNNDNQYESPYGKLYNWYAIIDPRNVCPSGWHVPTDMEWTVYTDFLGGELVAGGKMKNIGTQNWQTPNAGASNESGFLGLPGGIRGGSGSFTTIGYEGSWWSSTEYDSNSALDLILNYNNSNSNLGNGLKNTGISVRCLRD